MIAECSCVRVSSYECENRWGRAFLLSVSSNGVECHESGDFGETCASPVLVDAFDAGIENYLFAAFDGRSVHVSFWRLTDDGVRDVMYASSIDGTGWSQAYYLAAAEYIGIISFIVNHPFPTLDVFGDRIIAIWAEVSMVGQSNINDLFLSVSEDQGMTFGPPDILETASEWGYAHLSKDITSTGDVLHLVTTAGYAQSLDGGATWSDIIPERAGRAIASDAGWTAIASDDNGLHLIRF